MGDWISFLIFIGLFFIMMKYGCGAHMMHGGHGTHKHHKEPEDINHYDPVCGMKIDISEGYGKMYDHTLYRFCSRSCLDKFESNPDLYVTKSERDGGAP